MQELATLGGTFVPEVGAPIVGPACPYLIEGWNVVAGIGETLPKTIGGEGDELGFRVDEIHLLGGRCWLLGVGGLLSAKTAETAKAATGLGRVLAGLYAVEYVLRLGLVVDARVVAPTVGGKDERSDEIELAVAGGTVGIAGAVGLAAPGKIAFADAVLMLHVAFSPAPQTVEDILFAKLHGNHQAVRHSLGAGIVVLDVGDVAH